MFYLASSKKDMKYTRCSSIDQLTKTNCTFGKQCIGYMGTTNLVLNGYCVPRKLFICDRLS